jgi:hypothetical protein
VPDDELNKRPKSPDRNPTKPVTVTRGNRSAVATPTRAVAAASRRSAARTSGRLRSKAAASSPSLPMGSALA